MVLKFILVEKMFRLVSSVLYIKLNLNLFNFLICSSAVSFRISGRNKHNGLARVKLSNC